MIVDVADMIEKGVDALSRHSGNVNDGRVGHIGKGSADSLVEAIHRAVVLFNQIPLVDGNDHCLACLMGNSRNLFILLGDAR